MSKTATSNNNNNNNSNNHHSQKPKQAASDFICTLKFSNQLPELPFDPKLLNVPLDPSRLYKYQPNNSLERDYKHAIIPGTDLGVPLNFIDPHTYQCSTHLKSKGLLRKDKELLSDETEGKGDHTVLVPWLHKTQYMTHDFSKEILYGRAMKPKSYETNLALKSIEEQVSIIEQQFEAAQLTPVHPTKPNLKPVKVLPLMPDFEHWRAKYSQFIFDQDPGTQTKDKQIEQNKQRRDEVVSAGLISALQTNRNEDYAIFAYPNLSEDMSVAEFKNLPEDEREYKFVREYNFNIINDNKSKKEVFILFDQENSSAVYNFVESKVELKRRAAEMESESFANSGNSIIKLRKLNGDDAEPIYAEREQSLKKVEIVDEDMQVENSDEEFDLSKNNNNTASTSYSKFERQNEDKSDDDDDIGDDEIDNLKPHNPKSPPKGNGEQEDDEEEDSDVGSDEDIDVFG